MAFDMKKLAEIAKPRNEMHDLGKRIELGCVCHKKSQCAYTITSAIMA